MRLVPPAIENRQFCLSNAKASFRERGLEVSEVCRLGYYYSSGQL